MGDMAISVNATSPAEEDPIPEMRSWGKLSLVIEAPKGTYRSIRGGESQMYMNADYGFVADTLSMEEGDGLDVFINPESPDTSLGQVYTIGMLSEEGILEEEKAFLNFPSAEKAKDCFMAHYSSEKLGYLYQMTDEDFTRLALARQTAAKLKDSNPALVLPSEEEAENDSGEEVDIEEAHEELKSSVNVPIYKMAKGLKSEQLLKVIALRRMARHANKG